MFYGGNGGLLGYAVALALSVQAFVGVIMILYFSLMNFYGLLRVSNDDEESGLDLSHHGGASYSTSKRKRPPDLPDQFVASPDSPSRGEEKTSCVSPTAMDEGTFIYGS